MRFFSIALIALIALMFIACSPIKKGDYVRYTSDDYIFLHNNFMSKSIDCVELGKMKEGNLEVKYCMGENYASRLVEGFVFAHEYNNDSERFIGSSIMFKAKNLISFDCSSETLDDAKSGTEYINCMVSPAGFSLISFLLNSGDEIQGSFSGAFNRQKIYKGIIDSEGKSLLRKFYKYRVKQKDKKWKERSL